MKYGFIKEECERYPVTLLCHVMQVKRSSYYDWKKHRSCKVISAEEFSLRSEMKRLFIESRSSLGSRMLSKQLQSLGFSIGRDRTRRLMKAMALTVKKKRKYKLTTDSGHSLPIAENILSRQFNPAKPNQTWGTDITYVWTSEGWLYLAVVIDLYSRRVVGWCMDKRMKKSLAIRALMMAVNLRKPKSDLVHHSDRIMINAR